MQGARVLSAVCRAGISSVFVPEALVSVGRSDDGAQGSTCILLFPHAQGGSLIFAFMRFFVSSSVANIT